MQPCCVSIEGRRDLRVPAPGGIEKVGNVRVGEFAIPVGGAPGLGEADRLYLPPGVGLPDGAGDVGERRAPRAEVVVDDHQAGLAPDGGSQVLPVRGGVPVGGGGDAGETGMPVLGNVMRKPLPDALPCKRGRQFRRRCVVLRNILP